MQRNLDDDPSYRETWSPLIPLGRIAEPEDMVGPTVFLASEESSHVTGSCSTSTAAGPRWARFPRDTSTSRNASSNASIDFATPAAAEPGFVLLLPGRRLNPRLAGDGDRVPAARARGHALAGTGRVVGFAGLLPFAVFALPAGVAADRWNRKRLMIAADGVRAVAIATLATTILLDRVPFWQIAIVPFIEGTGSLFFNTAHAGALRAIVPGSSCPQPWGSPGREGRW